MKKIVFLAVISASLCASQNSDYVGVGVGQSWLKIDNSVKKVTNSGLSGTFVLGHKYGDYGRFYASGTYISSSENVDNSALFSVVYDFMLPVVDNVFSLYAGPNVGYTMYTEGNVDLSGVHYGAEVGAVVDITKRVELEAGYRYLKETGTDGSMQATSLQSAYFQLNISFNGDDYFKYE